MLLESACAIYGWFATSRALFGVVLRRTWRLCQIADASEFGSGPLASLPRSLVLPLGFRLLWVRQGANADTGSFVLGAVSSFAIVAVAFSALSASNQIEEFLFGEAALLCKYLPPTVLRIHRLPFATRTNISEPLSVSISFVSMTRGV